MTPPPHDGRDDRPGGVTAPRGRPHGLRTYVVGSRQSRPNLPDAGCPFCPGGPEAPEDYDVRWFRNRWPHCPTTAARSCSTRPSTTRRSGRSKRGEHGRWSISGRSARRRFGARPDVECSALVFENRGAEVGATIAHPHGQIYAFDFVRTCRPGARARRPVRRPRRPAGRDRAGLGRVGAGGADLPVRPEARARRAGARPPSLDDAGRNGLAVLPRGRPAGTRPALRRPDAVHARIHQRPFDGRDWPQARRIVEIVTPWRAPGVPRFVAAGELGSGVHFNPVALEAAAQSLREARA